MMQRVITALVLAPLAIGAVLFAPTRWFMPGLALVLLAGLWEWLRLCGVASRPARAALLALHAAALVLLALSDGSSVFPLVIAAGVAWWLLALAWLRRPGFGAGPAWRPARIATGTLFVLPSWCAMVLLHADSPHGPRWVLFGLLIVWAADTFAYFAGSRIGGPKLAPRISPGKTWAGFWGGLVGAALVSVAAVPLLGLGWPQWPALAVLVLVTALASVHGDLIESLVKRQSGAKDSGHLIPGHGGVMDRIDSIVAALPVFALGKTWIGL